MNLIELFESKPFQDVGTFNAIFKTTPILGFPANASVEIKELAIGSQRRVLVNGETLFMDLPTQIKKAPVKTKRIAEVNRIKRKNKRYYQKKKTEVKQPGKLPAILRELSPSQFFIYTCFKHLGEVTVAELCASLNIQNNRSVHNHVKALLEKGYVVKKGNAFSVDTTEKA